MSGWKFWRRRLSVITLFCLVAAVAVINLRISQTGAIAFNTASAIEAINSLSSGQVIPSAQAAAECGINIDPANSNAAPDPQLLQGVGWARFVFNVGSQDNNLQKAFDFYDSYIEKLNDVGVKVVLILNQQTYWGNGRDNYDQGNFSNYATDFAYFAGEVAAHYSQSGTPQVDAYEIWNEPDDAGGASLGSEDLKLLFSETIPAIRNQSSAEIILGGFIQDAPAIANNYLVNMPELVGQADAVSGHPYQKDPGTPLKDYIDTLLDVAPAVWLTEFTSVGTSLSPQGTDDPEASAQYVKEFYETLAGYSGNEVPVAIWYSWSDSMDSRNTNANFGLVDADGIPKQPLYDTFFTEACQAEPTSPNKNKQSNTASGSDVPLFVFPQTENVDEWKKYLANSQVYCAPPQVNWPELEGTDPSLKGCNPQPNIDPLGVGAGAAGDGYCDAQEYPVVDYAERYSLNRATIPLWRDQDNSISIELDLSRVNPDQTLVEALKSNSRPDYAPQFFLTTPQQQCTNAVNYLEYVDKMCRIYPADNDSATDCPQQDDITLPDGRIISWQTAQDILTAETCLDPRKDITGDSVAAQLIRTLAPRTPRIFKIGFLVQYNYTHGGNDPLSTQYLIKKLASWFSNAEDPADASRGEKVTIVPVWYQSGISTNEYTTNQTQPYPIDPDPQTNPAIENPQAELSTTNFVGPWWRTYAPALPLSTQKQIMQQKSSIVRETYETQNYIENNFGFGVAPGVTLPYYGEDYPTDGLIPCYNAECLVKDQEYYEDLQASFPDSFQPEISSDFYELLQKAVIQRVNAGRQATAGYPQEFKGASDSASLWGPLSERSFKKCPIDQENYRMGESDSASSINYNLLQNLREGNFQGAGDAITSIVNKFTGKVLWDKQQADYQQLHQSYSYLVLPDESIDIDIAQAYFAPMFLSPEMYASIMSGENPIYPFADDAPDSMPEDANYNLSAFLRTGGYNRSLQSGEEGYARYEITITQYAQDCQAVADPAKLQSVRECSCGINVISQQTEPMFWSAYPQQYQNQEPSLDNNCTKTEYRLLEKSTVSVTGNQYGESPDSNIENPGNLAALHEYLRRMAFTPLHLIDEYQGLETFYGGQYSSLFDQLSKQFDLSGYFEQLKNIDQTYGNAHSDKTCGAVYVDQAKAQQYYQELSQVFNIPGFREMARTKNNFYPGGALFGECGGGDCFEFIMDVILNTPVCNGDRYINPYVAIGIAMNESGALAGSGDQNLGFHFGCSPASFTDYNYGSDHNGFACVVENGAGNDVVNPLLVWGDDVVQSCIPNTASPNYDTVRKNQTVEDGLACMVMTFHRYCQSLDVDKLDAVGLTGSDGGLLYGYGDFRHPFARIVEVDGFQGSGDLMRMAREAARAAGQADIFADLEKQVTNSVYEVISSCQ